MSDSYRLEEKLFADALALPPAERAGFLVQACAGDDELRSRVEALVREHEEGGDFLESPPERELAEAARQANENTVPAEAAGSQVGRYTLLEKIGEGGCGVVYCAEQTVPVRRRVALKIIKLGMDTKAVIARFEAERQALALMDHPNIARALDAGATETGRPFFVMELVDGSKITDYCDEHRLRPEERLKLFVQVCQAVQHAHQKGIIHRDLKPSNILVTSQDGAAVPKVIDFGIAKATQGRLTDHTLFTAFEQFIGTPAYMSPEQADFGAVDIDTRSDIYSLGVLLYELLTGRTPLEAAEMRESSVDEVRRRIRDEEAPRPSARLRTLNIGTLATAAEHRRIEPLKLVHLVSGDLDWIVMRCLEKDRTRRYETANALARDIERYLRSEPVTARPPSGAYVLGKFIRRHQFGVAASGAIALVLIAGIVASTRLYFLKTAALTQAEANERKAQTEAARSAEVARFMEDMLNGVAPAVAQGRDTKLLRDLLDATVSRLAELDGQPEVQADLQLTLGRVYQQVGEMVRAENLLTAALGQQRRLHGDVHPKTADTLHWLGVALRGQSKVDQAIGCQRESVAIWRKLRGDHDPALLSALNSLGSDLLRIGRNAEARSAYGESLAIARQLPAGNNPAIAQALFGLGLIFSGEKQYLQAETTYREILGQYLQDDVGPDQVILKNSVLFRLGETLWLRARQEPDKEGEAEAILRESLAFERRFLGEQNQQTPQTLNILANLLSDHGRLAEAVDVMRGVVVLDKKRLEREPANQTVAVGLARSLKNLGEMLSRHGQPAEGEGNLREALAVLHGTPAPPRNNLIEALVIHGGILVRLGRLEEAERAFREALPLEEQALDWHIIRLAAGFHRTFEQQGRVADLESTWSRLVDRSRRMTGAEAAGEFATGLITAMAQVGRHIQAEAFARENLSEWEKRRPDDWHVFAFRVLLGNALVEQRKFAEAEPLLLSGCGRLRERPDLIPTQSSDKLLFPFQNLVRLYTEWGKPEQAAVWQKKQQEILSVTSR